MDYFDSNFNDNPSDHETDLPEGFGWDDMKDGIYHRMDTKKPSKLSKYWPLLALLFLAGCGSSGWMALEYFNNHKPKPSISSTEKKPATENGPTVLDPKIHASNDPTTLTTPINASTSTTKAVKEINNTTTSNNTILNNTTSKTTGRETFKPKSIIPVQNHPIPAPKNSKSHLPNIQLTKPQEVANPQKKQTINKPTNTNEASKNLFTSPLGAFNKVISIHFLPFGKIESETNSPKYSFYKKEIPKTDFKKHLELSLAGGIANWRAGDRSNINHDNVSGFPGYVINPSLSIFIKQNQAIQIDYEYASFEELFDYDGSRDVYIYQENQVVQQLVNSLTGEVISSEREDVISPGTRRYREVKYNQYKSHTLSLGHRFAKKISSKSSLGFYTGLSYLLSLDGEGKRLDKSLDVIIFNKANPLFQRNQFALRFGFSYDYQIGKNMVLFSQVMTTKYLSNWELNSSDSATRPFFYGVQVGVRKRLGF